MRKSRRNCGFSLVEVLLAVGTLAIGMIFIGGTYLVGIHFAGVSAERTTATIVANEAFAKMKIFGVDMSVGDPNLGLGYSTRYRFEAPTLSPFAYDEFAYPSTRTRSHKQYFWSALCRRDPNDPDSGLLATVFVSRKVGSAAMYNGPRGPIAWPVVMAVGVTVEGPDVLGMVDDPGTQYDETRWIGPGYTIVEDSSGDIYRVLKHVDDPTLPHIVLDRPWDPRGTYPAVDNIVWVVPPPIGRGKGPCISVYRTEISF